MEAFQIGSNHSRIHSIVVFMILGLLLSLSVTSSNAQTGDFAVLVSVSDSLGNENTNSFSTGTGGNWSCGPDCPDLILEVGDQLTITAEGYDPNGRPLEFRFLKETSSSGYLVVQDWSSENVYVWDVLEEDIGPWTTILVAVRNDDTYDYQASAFGDDYTYMTYTVYDPNYIPATLVSVYDSLGNVNTNSITKGTGTAWSCGTTCPDLSLGLGDEITITAEATDPSGLPLEYRFMKETVAGSSVVQDWSSTNQYQWAVTLDDLGPYARFIVCVRNNDGQDWQGLDVGDDYTYLNYEVSDPNYLPAYLVEIHDNLGNVNHQSLTTGTYSDWPEPPLLSVGDVITLTAIAEDPRDLPLQYMFEKSTSSGGYELLQDWGDSNTVSWEVSLDDYGPQINVLIHVRNNDGHAWQGDYEGDDYSSAIYAGLRVRALIDAEGGDLLAPNANNEILLEVPQNTVSDPTEFTYTENMDYPDASGDLMIIGNAFDLTAMQGEENITTFTSPVDLTLNCDPAWNPDPSSVVLMYYDTETDAWVLEDENSTMIGDCSFVSSVDHFSLFAFAGREAPESFGTFVPLLLR